jgi:hypothetical protein
VPDAILDRMKTVTLEEAWAVVTAAGFSHQYDDSWVSIHPEKILVGRVGRRQRRQRDSREERQRHRL